jgi:hypothetical protein
VSRQILHHGIGDNDIELFKQSDLHRRQTVFRRNDFIIPLCRVIYKKRCIEASSFINRIFFLRELFFVY